MMGSMRDEELFMATQQQEGGGEEDLYLELEKAITERKCRILQKKQKLRLIINDMKKKKEASKSARNVNKCQMKEREENSNQKKIRVQNITKAQGSRGTSETSLCDLNNKLSFEKAETKRKKDEFDTAIKNAHDKWESYKEQYENFPLSKKLRGVKVEIKKVECEIKQFVMDAADFKAKKRLKHQIAERNWHLSVVKLAEKYFVYQKKFEEHEEILRKIMEIEKKLADLKSGKMTRDQLQSSKVSKGQDSSKSQHVIQSPVNQVLFTSLGMQVTSPPPTDNEDESSSRKRLFNWDNLLGSSNLLSLSKKPAEKKLKSLSNPSVGDLPLASSASDLQSQKSVPFSSNKTGSSLKLTNLLRNISCTQRKPDMKVGHKRVNEDENKHKPHTEKMLLSKKVCKALPQSSANSDVSVTSLNNTVLKGSTPENVVKNDEVNKNLLNKENRENINSRNSISLSGVQSQLIENNQTKLTATTTISRGLNQNFMNILLMKNAGKERKTPGSHQKDIHEPVKTLTKESANNKKSLQNDHQTHYNAGDLFQSTHAGHQNQKFEEMPVETNTLSLSQADVNLSQIYGSPGNLVLSGGSDFISPNSADLDEDTRLVYQRIVAEAPIGIECSKVPMNAMSNQKSAPEDNTVRSQYFTNRSQEPHSLNTPPDPQAGDIQSPIPQAYSPIIHTQFDKSQSMDLINSPPPANTAGDIQSPIPQAYSPIIHTQFDKSQSMDLINSPPPANTDAFGGSVPASNPSVFSFMPNSFKTNSSVFDFF